MRILRTAAVAAGCLLLFPLTAAAQQQQQGGGWSGTLDQLNRAVNPDAYQEEQRRQREGQRDGQQRTRDDRRLEGSSGRDDRRDSTYSRLSDRDLRDQYERLTTEQRSIARERRDVEEELDRRGIRR